ncbi:MAG: type II secretion system protein GspN [Desulfobacterales bacterium]|nr:MAG: type II secretion system protein GspN [Desulfobacterales bacterium]
MKPSKRTLLYTAYIIGVTIFFLWYLFPSDTLKAYLAHRLNQVNSDVTVTIGKASLVLPPGIKLQEVVIARKTMTLIDLKSLKVMPELRSLFSDKTTVNFKGGVYEGSLAGRMEIGDAPQGHEIKIDGNIAGIQVQQISNLKQLTEHEISGSLEGNFTYADTKPGQSLSGNLTLTNCRIILAEPVFNQKSFEFKNIRTDLTLQNNILVIKQFSAKGNQLDLNLAGDIGLITGDPAKNRLNLTGTVTPHHVFLAKIENDIPVEMLRNKKTGSTAISFKVDGTMDDPGFSLN